MSNPYLRLEAEQLIGLAKASIKVGDARTLHEIDEAFLMRYRQASVSGRDKINDFVRMLVRILESEEAGRYDTEKGPVHFLTKWQQLADLADSKRATTDVEASASRAILSHDRGEALLNKIATAGPLGVTVGDLARILETTAQYLVRILNKFEGLDLIERHRSGKEVYVTLGLQGQISLRKAAAISGASGTPTLVSPQRGFPRPFSHGARGLDRADPSMIDGFAHTISLFANQLQHEQYRRRLLVAVMGDAFSSIPRDLGHRLLIDACEHAKWESWVLTCFPSLFWEDAEIKDGSSREWRYVFLWTDVYLRILEQWNCNFQKLQERCDGRITLVKVSKEMNSSFEEFTAVVQGLEDRRVATELSDYRAVLADTHHWLSVTRDVLREERPKAAQSLADASREVLDKVLKVGV